MTATMDDSFSLNLYHGQILMALDDETAESNSEMSNSTAMAARQALSNQTGGELKQFEESPYGAEYTKPEASDSDLQEGRDGEDDSELDIVYTRHSQEPRGGKSQYETAKVTEAKKKSRTTKKTTPKAAKAEQPRQSESTATRSVRNHL